MPTAAAATKPVLRPEIALDPVEWSNSRLGEECLNTHRFLSREDARAKIVSWRRGYNESRPHLSFGWLTTVEHAASTAKITAE